MGPTKFSIPAALAVLLLAMAPAAFAQEAATSAAETAPEPAVPAAGDAVAAELPDEPDSMGALPDDTATPSEVPDDTATPSEVPDDTEVASEVPDDAEVASALPDDGGPVADAPDAPAEQAALDTHAPTEQAALDTHPPLGAIGYDSQGRQGRIHIVVRGDTLWDVSNAYLGTPWVWPSIWQDNGEIENPHRIFPGDRIWITPSEMRRISEQEAAILLSNLPPEPEPPAAQEDLTFDEPALPEATEPVIEPVEYGRIRVANRENAGLITAEQMEASASIVGREHERIMLSQEDEVYVGLGEGDVEAGDQLTVFRTHEKVFDPDTGVLLGYHVEFLGWVEVTKPTPETSLARIGMSTGGLEQGDRVIPREPLPPEIPLKASPAVEGKISFFPQKRVVIGYNDFVYLNRGTIDGLEVGSPLDVYRPGYDAEEEARDEEVLVPDAVIGRLVVVRAEDESAVAWVMRSNTELALGDRFRGADL